MSLPNDIRAKRRSSVRSPRGQRQDRAGFAIVLTLIVIVMMTVLVIGFNAATRTEQMAARNYSYQEQANQMAMLAVNRGLELINSKIAGANAVTQPGQVFVPSSGATPLSSAAFAASGASVTNVNIWQEDKGKTNYFISTNTDSAAFSAPLVVEKSGTNVMGQYAFWIDDDGSRLNLNAASSAGQRDFLPTNARPLVLNGNVLPGMSVTISDAFSTLVQPESTSVSTNGWGYFFTPRQITGLADVGPANYNKMMFQIAGGPLSAPDYSSPISSVDLPPSGFLPTNGTWTVISNSLTKYVGTMFTNANLTKYFGNHFLAKYGTNFTWQMLANMSDAMLPASTNAFAGAVTNASANESMMESSQPASAPSPINNPSLPIPKYFLGIRPAPFLNEVGVGVTQTPEPPGIELGVWMQAELVDPYQSPENGTNTYVVFRMDQFGATGSYKTNNVVEPFAVSLSGWNWNGRLTNSQSIGQSFALAANLTTNGAIITTNNAVYFDFKITIGSAVTVRGLATNVPAIASNMVISNITVRPGLALLVAATNDPNNRRSLGGNEVLTVRDWAAPADFTSFTWSTNEIAYLPTNIPPRPSGQTLPLVTALPTNCIFSNRPSSPGVTDTNPPLMKSISKNDPRMRRFSSYPPPVAPWASVASTLGANNANVDFDVTVTLTNTIAGQKHVVDLRSDRYSAGGSIYNHPSFAKSSSWASPYELSKIHTGLPWRTLQFRAQNLSEATNANPAPVVPDWAFLELLKPGPRTNVPPVRINVNSACYPGAAGQTNVATLLSNGLARSAALVSLFTGFTNSGASSGLSAGASLSTSANSNTFYAKVASNAATMAFNTTNTASTNYDSQFGAQWASRRSSNQYFPKTAYLLASELFEIDGIADNPANDEAGMEDRARAVYESVTTSSDVFTIYAAGFATDKQGNSIAEARVRAQVARDTTTGKFKIVFLEPLIWP
jgi:Tfp pilus assembly protein PilX